MEKVPTFVPVVAVAIRDFEGRLLLQQCAAHKHHAGLWEFPGGKVEVGEIPRLALCREVSEELGLAIQPASLEPAGFAEEPPADNRPGLVLLLYTCERWSGTPASIEGQAWGWFTSLEAMALELPPMDRTLLERLTG